MIKIEIDNPKLEEHIARLIASQDSGAQKPLHQLPREALVNLHREIDAILSGGVPTPQHVADPSGQIVLMPTANPHRREFAILIDGEITAGADALVGLCKSTAADLAKHVRAIADPTSVRGPAPPAAPTPYESRYGDLDSLISEGAAAWQALLSTWIQNWGVDGAPQPDRTEALMTAFGAYAKEVGAYVRERGGLGGACIDTLVNARMVPADDAVPTGKRLALNIVQVGTALGIPLDKLVEASLITETGKLSAKPPTPGMVQDLLDDRDRPPELGDTRV